MTIKRKKILLLNLTNNNMRTKNEKNKIDRRNYLDSIAAAAARFDIMPNNALKGIEVNRSRTLPSEKPLPIFNVSNFGFAGVGDTLNTSASQILIDNCSKNEGGTLFFPPGKFLTGIFMIRDNVHIYLSPGGRVRGGKNKSDYSHDYVVNAEDAKNRNVTWGETIAILLILLISAFIAGCSEGADTIRQAEKRIPFDFPDLQPPVFANQTFDIREYGAKSGDSTFLNTEAIRSAISACFQAGGGKVLVPSGVWFTGPVHLKSNVNLHLEDSAELRFSQKFEDYLPVVLVRTGRGFGYSCSPFVYARDAKNIAVTGSGTLNGRGQSWWPWAYRKQNNVGLIQLSEIPVEDKVYVTEETGMQVFGTEEAGMRPSFIQLIECKNVYLQGITVKDGPAWNIHPAFCENLIIRDIRIDALGPNNDGIDPDACKNVLIENCTFNTGDNAIAMKSGYNETGWKLGRSLENVVIRHSTVYIGGGIAIGSEMSGGVKNVLIEDCHFIGSGLGLRFKSQLGRGGIVENVWARNITMENITKIAISFDFLYFSKPVAGPQVNAPTFRNFYIENLTCEKTPIGIQLVGLPGNYLRELHFKNIHIKAKTALISQDVNDISFENVKIESISE
jgi:polygalacturonase